jgi:hypothetical protein
LLNSFPALYQIYTSLPHSAETRGIFWTSFWFSSEIVGEIGLTLRFAGACLFLVFTWLLLQKKQLRLPILRKAVLLEGTYYLFYLPFIAYLFTRPTSSARAQTVYYLTASSYTIQTVLVFSTFILLYAKTRRPNVGNTKLLKWGAIALVGFAFSLWVKHFLFNLYALPIDLANAILFSGLLNSTFTLLTAALILLFAFLPVIRGKIGSISLRLVGGAFVLVGVYFVIYVLVALTNPTYMGFLTLTELWAVSFAVLGAGLLLEREQG